MAARGKTLADAQLRAWGYVEINGQPVQVGKPLAPLTPTRAVQEATGPRARPEEIEQKALFDWIHTTALPQEPLFVLLYHTPNGEYRTPWAGKRIKDMGGKAGVLDLFWPVARQGYHGHYGEMKAPGKGYSESQQAWVKAMQEQRYSTALYYSWVEAATHLCWYIGREDLARGLER